MNIIGQYFSSSRLMLLSLLLLTQCTVSPRTSSLPQTPVPQVTAQPEATPLSSQTPEEQVERFNRALDRA